MVARPSARPGTVQRERVLALTPRATPTPPPRCAGQCGRLDPERSADRTVGASRPPATWSAGLRVARAAARGAGRVRPSASGRARWRDRPALVHRAGVPALLVGTDDASAVALAVLLQQVGRRALRARLGQR